MCSDNFSYVNGVALPPSRSDGPGRATPLMTQHYAQSWGGAPAEVADCTRPHPVLTGRPTIAV
jgi:hypothetical protein